MGSMGESDQNWEVVVVGGGFCGCWALKNLRKEGFKVHMYEWGSALGGKPQTVELFPIHLVIQM